MAAVNTYRIDVSREGRWWMVAVPELDLLTQARNIAEVERMARSIISLALEVALDTFSIDVHVDAHVDYESVLKRVQERRRHAKELEAQATQDVVAAAKALAREGLTVRDIGQLLQVSHQRAQQLINA